jgi:ABC-type branched-subunit amino acid transport system ATPase component
VIAALLGAPWQRAFERADRTRAQAIIEQVGLGAWAEVQVAELSTGTRRICDLAAQIACEPDVLLLDEPTAGVAQREAETFGPMLRCLAQEHGWSVLVIEHDMPLLMGLADRIYCLERGRVISEGTPAEVRDDPIVVASYLGTTEAAIARSGRGRTSTQRRKPRVVRRVEGRV